ncbi:MAG: ATP-binding cassette domain-containing protein, partial [Aquimonas sp.]
AYGAWAGLVGGRSERLMMRALDVLSALPFLLLVILLLALFERSLWLLLAAIAGQAWIDLARVMRAEAARLRDSGFVLAARAAGAGRVDLLRRHVIPNLMPLALVYAGLIAANVVLVESFLGFLGLGLSEPWAGLGALLGEGAQELDTAPWGLIGPALLLCVLLLTFQRLGEALRDALDPRLLEAAPNAAAEGEGRIQSSADATPPTAKADAAIAVDGLTITLPDDRAIGPLSFALARGECLGLIGGSGSGKSLSALALSGLLPRGLRAQGRLRLGDRCIDLAEALPVELRGRQIGLVFQDPLASLHPLRSVGSLLRESLRQLRGLRGAALEAAARAALIEVGLGEAQPAQATEVGAAAHAPHASMTRDGSARGSNALSVERFLRARPGQLSGGQRQRVMIALALCGQPQLLICDEATSALDLLSQHEVLELLQRLRRERGLALLFIGHDLDVVARLADQLCVLERGRVVEQGPTAEVLARPRAGYTLQLLAARCSRAAPEPLIAAQDTRAAAHADEDAESCADDCADDDARTPAGAAVSSLPSSAGAAPAPLLRLRGFGLRYPRAAGAAVQGADLEVARGECLAVLGASGSGKSSLVRGLLQLTDARIEGEAWLQDAPLHGLAGATLRQLRPRAQIVFQDPYSSLDPRQRITDLLAEPLA